MQKQHLITGFDIDTAAVEHAIRLSEEKYCSVGAMVQKTARFNTTYEISEENTEWLAQQAATRIGTSLPSLSA